MEIVFTVCSILIGAHCFILDPMPLQEGAGMMGCMIAGQVEGAKYTLGHPNYYVSKYTCESFGKYTRL